jgi:hypothetical protein
MARSRVHTELAMAAAERAEQALLLDEALDQLIALEIGDRRVADAIAAVDRRLEVLRDVPVDAASGFEVYDALHMACHVNLAGGRLRAARRYADDVAALPFFREERHIGLGRRVEVDAVAGDFDAVIARADLFERDWRRAGRPVASNLAVGAYAVAMTFGMVADEAARRRWIDITESLLGVSSGRSRGYIWAAVLDAMLALHRDHPDEALALLDRNPTDPVDNANHVLWIPWYAALWAEASVLCDHPASATRLVDAAAAAAGNDIAVLMVERAHHLRDGNTEAVGASASRFDAADCPYQADRARRLAGVAG